MKKVLALFLALFYTFLSFGGSIYVHHCNSEYFLSIYEKKTTKDCPICIEKHAHADSENSCSGHSCKDLEVKIEQPTETITMASSPFFACQPAIIPRLWVLTNPIEVIVLHNIENVPINYAIGDSSPPTYLVNCIFRT